MDYSLQATGLGAVYRHKCILEYYEFKIPPPWISSSDLNRRATESLMRVILPFVVQYPAYFTYFHLKFQTVIFQEIPDNIIV